MRLHIYSTVFHEMPVHSSTPVLKARGRLQTGGRARARARARENTASINAEIFNSPHVAQTRRPSVFGVFIATGKIAAFVQDDSRNLRVVLALSFLVYENVEVANNFCVA